MNKPLTRDQLKILRIERLILIQHYKNFILVECRCCKEIFIFPESEEEVTWSCETCDRKRI